MWNWISNLFKPSTSQTSSTSLPSNSLSVTNSPILGGTTLGGSQLTAQSTPQISSAPKPSSPSNLPSTPLSVVNNPILGGTGLNNIGGNSGSTPSLPSSFAPATRSLSPIITNSSSGGTAQVTGTQPVTPITQGTARVTGTQPVVPIGKVFNTNTQLQSAGSSFSSPTFLPPSASSVFSPSSFMGSSLMGTLPSSLSQSEEERKKKNNNQDLGATVLNTLIPSPVSQPFSAGVPSPSLIPNTRKERNLNSVSQAEVYADLERKLSEDVKNEALANPMPDAPIKNDDYQEEIIRQQPIEQQRGLQEEVDRFKAGLGYTDKLKQLDVLGLELEKINKTFNEAIQEIENNPELPKGLAARRVADLAKSQNIAASFYLGQIRILQEGLDYIDAAVNEKLKIYELSQPSAPDTPGSVQEYQYAVSQGYNGSYTDFKSLNSSGVTINMGEQIQGAVEKQNALQNAADTQTINSAYKTISDITKKYGVTDPKQLTMAQASQMTDADALAIGKAASIIQNPLSSKTNPDDIQDALQPATWFGQISQAIKRQIPGTENYDREFAPSKLVEAVISSSAIAEGRNDSQLSPGATGTTSSGLRYVIE